MKKIRIIFAIFIILTLLCTTSCKNKNNENNESNENDIQDAVVPDFPVNCWLTDSIILSELPDDINRLFGEGGDSGILSDYAIKNNGKVEQGKKAYFVNLVYCDTALELDAEIDTNITLVAEDRVLHNDAADSSYASILRHASGEYNAWYNTSNKAFVLHKDRGDSELQYANVIKFAVVTEFYTYDAGTLYYDFKIDTDTDIETKYFNSTRIIELEASEKQYSVNVDSLTVGYLTESEYNYGDFSDTAIKQEPSVTDGVGYMVVDFKYSALNDNDGDRRFGMILSAIGRGRLDITIEDAPTSGISEIESLDATVLRADFSVPVRAGDSKSVRMIVRLMSLSGGMVPFSIIPVGDAGTELTGDLLYKSQRIDAGEPRVIYTLNEDGKSYTLSRVSVDISGIFVIPDVLPDGLPVTHIGDSVFGYSSKITGIVIPKGIVSIGERAFSGCKITSVVIPDSVETIGEGAFSSCSNLSEITLGKSVTVIGETAFYQCVRLTSITIPDSVTSIGDRAFDGCYKLVEVINHSALDIIAGSEDNGYIGYYAKEVHTGESRIVNNNGYLFYTYDGVNYLLGYIGNDKELSLPESYNGENYQIYKYAFNEPYFVTIGTGVTSIAIPDSVTSIADHAFYGCRGLTSITIPNGVTSIGEDAFRGCDNLEDVYYKGTEAEWDMISISYQNVELLRTTRYYYSETQPTKSGYYWHYGDNGEIVVW